MNDDDDLPVLTHVLRTGHVERPVDAAATSEGTGTAEAPLFDPLVIGHESHVGVEAYLVQPADDDDGYAEAFEPMRSSSWHDDDGSDAFALSQDIDAHGGNADRTPIDEPHMASMHDGGGHEASSGPVAPSQVDPAEVARSVRDAVLDAVLDGLGARIDTELDARIAQAIHAEVEASFARLHVQLRANLTEALRDVVGRAIDEEIASLQHARPQPGSTD